MGKYFDYEDLLLYAVHEKTGAMLFSSTDVRKFEELENEFKEKYPQLAKEMVVWQGFLNRHNLKNINACLEGAEFYQQILEYSRGKEIKPSQYIYEVQGLDWTEDAVFNSYGKFTTLKKAKEKAAEIMKPFYQLEKIEIHQVLLDSDEDTVVVKYKTDKYGRFVKEKEDNYE